MQHRGGDLFTWDGPVESACNNNFNQERSCLRPSYFCRTLNFQLLRTWPLIYCGNRAAAALNASLPYNLLVIWNLEVPSIIHNSPVAYGCNPSDPFPPWRIPNDEASPEPPSMLHPAAPFPGIAPESRLSAVQQRESSLELALLPNRSQLKKTRVQSWFPPYYQQLPILIRTSTLPKSGVKP